MNIHVNLKLLAVLTILFSIVIFTLAFVYNVPVAYVPYGATQTEYILSHAIFISFEVGILAFLFMHMIKNSKLDFSRGLTKLLA